MINIVYIFVIGFASLIGIYIGVKNLIKISKQKPKPIPIKQQREERRKLKAKKKYG